MVGILQTADDTPVEGYYIEVYRDDLCTLALHDESLDPAIRDLRKTNQYGWWAVDLNVPINQETSFYVRARNTIGNASDCSLHNATYTHDGIAPAIAQINSVYPEGPSYVTNPTVEIQSEPKATVELFETSDCTGTAIASGTADSTTGLKELTLDLSTRVNSSPADRPLELYVKATDLAGNSVCSSLQHEYVVYEIHNAMFKSISTMATSDSDKTNPSSPEKLKISIPDEDYPGFTPLSTTTGDVDEIVVPKAGDYLIMVNLPVISLNERSNTRVYVEVYDSSDTLQYRSEFSKRIYSW